MILAEVRLARCLQLSSLNLVQPWFSAACSGPVFRPHGRGDE